MTPAVFWLLAGIIILPAIAVVTSKNLFHAGLSMVVSFLGIAAVYAALSAPFVAGIQVLVYAGAIAVLLLFAFMLTHDIMKPMEGTEPGQKIMAFVGCLLLAGILGRVLFSANWAVFKADPNGQSIEDIGVSLLSNNLVSFELISVLLLTTLIGAVVVARKEELNPEVPIEPETLAELPEGQARDDRA